MLDVFRLFWADESGQGKGDYSLFFIVLIAILIVAIVVFNDAILDFFSWINRTLNTRL